MCTNHEAPNFVMLFILLLLALPKFQISVFSVISATTNVPTELSAADRWAADSTVGTLLQTAVYTAKVPLKMGETVAGNM